jgi:hypothetical protein
VDCAAHRFDGLLNDLADAAFVYVEISGDRFQGAADEKVLLDGVSIAWADQVQQHFQIAIRFDFRWASLARLFADGAVKIDVAALPGVSPAPFRSGQKVLRAAKVEHCPLDIQSRETAEWHAPRLVETGRALDQPEIPRADQIRFFDMAWRQLAHHPGGNLRHPVEVRFDQIPAFAEG